MGEQIEICQAELYIADDFEDNVATIKCMLPRDHQGQHEERYEQEVGEATGWVVVRWDLDERPYRYGVLIEEEA